MWIDAGIQQAVPALALVHWALRERFAAALTRDLRNPFAPCAGLSKKAVKKAPKYGETGSRIIVSIEGVHERLLLSVHHEEPPLAVEEQECLFQMYRRAKSAAATRQQGLGIGLPYVRAVAESHGGSIGLNSAAERSTTFIIDILIDCRPYLGAPSLA